MIKQNTIFADGALCGLPNTRGVRFAFPVISSQLPRRID